MKKKKELTLVCGVQSEGASWGKEGGGPGAGSVSRTPLWPLLTASSSRELQQQQLR